MILEFNRSCPDDRWQLKIMPGTFMRYIACFLLQISGGDLGAQDLIRLSLPQAIDMALKNNTEVAISEYQVNSFEYSVKESRGNSLPKINLNGTYSRNIDRQVIFLPEGLGPGGATKIGSNNNFISYLDLYLPLYSKYNSMNKDYANSSYNFQRESSRGIRQTVTVNVKKVYFAYLIALEVVKVREKALENALENFRNTQIKLLEGVVTEFDETTAQVRIAAVRNNVLEARDQLIPISGQLKLLLGLPIETELILTDSLSLTAEESAAVEDTNNLMNNSELKQKSLKVEMAKNQTSVVKAGYFPTLAVIGSYQFQSQENSFDVREYDWVKTSAIGLRLQFPVFNGMVTRNKVQQAKQAEKIAELQRVYTISSNRAQLEKLRSQLNYAKKRIELQNENIALSEKALGLVKERYHYGKGTFLEVNIAELEYITARLNYLQAILDYKSAYCDYELLTGIEI